MSQIIQKQAKHVTGNKTREKRRIKLIPSQTKST